MKKIFLACFIGVLLLQGCGEEHIPTDPDVVSSISMERDQYLTVIANRAKIENKEEFAWELIEMCQNNSFHTIKLSTDSGYATSLHMNVYLWKDEVEEQQSVMEIKYEPDVFDMDYDIINDSEHFKLYVDGNLVEQWQ